MTPVVPAGPIPQKTVRFLWAFSVTLVLTAGTAFFFKLYEFFHVATTTGADALASFLMPVLTYLIVAAGYGCLFLWAYTSGHYRDVEAPKFRMLELQDRFDELDELEANSRKRRRKS